jgi:hypothetical protein
MKTYTPQNWYWQVGADTTQFYSSVAGDFVPAADPTLVAWQADGTRPTKIDTTANLGDVLAPYNLRPVNAAVLDGYTSSQSAGLANQIVAKVLFNHENRIRVLEGKATITAQQFLQALKGLM